MKIIQSRTPYPQILEVFEVVDFITSLNKSDTETADSSEINGSETVNPHSNLGFHCFLTGGYPDDPGQIPFIPGGLSRGDCATFTFMLHLYILTGGYPDDPGQIPFIPGGLSRGDCATFPGLKHVLCFAFRTDNSGPPLTPQVQV